MTEAAQLSCEQCKQRKTKCDKESPCSACIASRLSCKPVQRRRLPRGRSKKVNFALQDKLSRLEKLVGDLEAQIHDIGPSDSGFGSGDNLLERSLDVQNPNKIEKMTARDFWLALSDEVSGLRETLESSEDEGDPQHCTPHMPARHVPLPTSHPATSLQIEQDAGLPIVPVHVRLLLVHLYQTRVDWLFKVLHWPSVSSMLNSSNSTYDAATPSSLALEYAIYFLASCTLLDHEPEQHHLGDRATLIETFQRATETLLSRAGLLVSTNITLLQAFVIYIAAIRYSVSAASAWTLLALAVRIAHACGLDTGHLEGRPVIETETETRRRLWYSIGLLDSHASFGRGTMPLLSYKDLTCPPATVNDADLFLGQVVPQTIGDFTDMSFSSLCHQAMVCQRKLIDPGFKFWRDRLDLVTSFERLVMQDVARFESSLDPRQRYTALLARGVSVTMQLLLRRPLYKNFKDAIPPEMGYNVLTVGCQVLQGGLAKPKSEEFAIYSWFRWPKWFALAVVLVELCSTSHGAVFDEAFDIAQKSYNDYAQSAADMKFGELWKPIAKLMRRVQSLKTDASKSHTMSNKPVDHVLSDNNASSFALIPAPETPLMPNGRLPGSENDDSWLYWDLFLDDVNGTALFEGLL